jgi:hypothetical protein
MDIQETIITILKVLRLIIKMQMRLMLRKVCMMNTIL